MYSLVAANALCVLVFGYWAVSNSGPDKPDEVATARPIKTKITGPMPKESLAPADESNPPASASTDPGTLLENALSSGDIQQQTETLDRLLPGWVGSDAMAAVGFAQSLPTGDLRSRALRIVAQAWGRQDSGAALAWLTALPDPTEREAFFTSVCLGLAEKDPQASVQLADQNQHRENGLLENLAQQWAAHDIPAVVAWATQRPPGDERDQLLQRIALVEAKTAPVQAAQLVIQQIQPGPVQMEAALSVVHQWAESDWTGATAWVQQFPDGPFRARAIAELQGMAADPNS